ncbi:MAG: hypothetical protein AVDCRST_MAG67-1112 [uncultured Solirubrobacteraceae bacterium]|uniref:Uncharacterized protein n=1 Tax=uncultured Solirubrobacteraceae bacterium TaxID=1162706 RepID=A0A6J4RW86_9ACTN|nr:MAG: hypothetical protein AVDCRST_MAG67-1112 [uncultured Solirubrobacteraceae bacterium]
MDARRAARSASTTAAIITAAGAARRLWRSPPVHLARMSGTSIAGPDAVGWMTDFLNAAYYARRPGLRDVEDLRVALAILTTRWHQLGNRRLRAPDVLAFHRAFFRERILDSADTPRGMLDREQLFAGAARLIGPWFEHSYRDDALRAHGIAFQSAAERAAYKPEHRLRHAKLGAPTPPERPRNEQVWHTYNPVEVSSAPQTLAALARPETWPDYASDLGRFTAVRSGGLAGQTFEIEVISALTPRTPAILRGYVTVTRFFTREDRATELEAYAERLSERMVRYGRDQPPAYPPGCTPLAAICLDTHEGHFMGRGRNRLLAYELDGRFYLRAAGTWDDLPVTLEQAYRSQGRKAQQAFWGDERAESSMLAQIAAKTRDP